MESKERRAPTNFSSGTLCVALASEKYDERDYIRDYDEFLKYKEQ